MVDPTPPTFNYPRTADEWWQQAAYVAAVMPEWGPSDEPVSQGVANARKLAAVGFPTIAEHIVRIFTPYGDATFYSVLRELIEKRDKDARWVFESVWSDAPDAPYIHGWTGWGRLCDLCSECYVLNAEPA